MAEFDYSKVVEWLEDWLKNNNGPISKTDPHSISRFMRDFGEQIIDTASYVPNNGGTNLILYTGKIGDAEAWQVVKAFCGSGTGCYSISNTYAGIYYEYLTKSNRRINKWHL